MRSLPVFAPVLALQATLCATACRWRRATGCRHTCANSFGSSAFPRACRTGPIGYRRPRSAPLGVSRPRTASSVLVGHWSSSGKLASCTSEITGYCSGRKSLTKIRNLTTSLGVVRACSRRRTTPHNADSTCSRSVAPCRTCPDTKIVFTPALVVVTTCVKPLAGSIYSTCAAAASGIAKLRITRWSPSTRASSSGIMGTGSTPVASPVCGRWSACSGARSRCLRTVDLDTRIPRK